jgi:hypothetical protein
MHLKVFFKLENPKNSSGQIYKKNQNNPKNPKKNQKTYWAGFFFKKSPGFF